MYLVGEVAAPDFEVDADVFEDGPLVLLVQLPGHVRHAQRAHAEHDGHRQDAPPDGRQEPGTDERRAARIVGRGGEQEVVRVANLAVLQGGLDEQAGVVQADADDLDRVLEPQRVVGEQDLVGEAEDEERQVRRNRARLRLRVRVAPRRVGDRARERAEDVAA